MVVVGTPPALLPPGTPLPGGAGVAGTFLATWTLPPRTLFRGWVATGEQPPSFPDWAGPGTLSAVTLSTPPADAGPPPDGGAAWVEVRVLGLAGWVSELLDGYP
jgi:hypothetical protein